VSEHEAIFEQDATDKPMNQAFHCLTMKRQAGCLRQYKILDTDPEQAFDDFTRLAAQWNPIALVSLIDESRQWFKSKVGLDAPETPVTLPSAPMRSSSPTRF